jgi:hypothetical protein
VKAREICTTAAHLVGGDRERTHGEKTGNHENIAALWSAYLSIVLRQDVKLSALDAALLMALLKIARTASGSHNPDDYVDLTGYGAVAGEIAEVLNGSETS